MKGIYTSSRSAPNGQIHCHQKLIYKEINTNAAIIYCLSVRLIDNYFPSNVHTRIIFKLIKSNWGTGTNTTFHSTIWINITNRPEQTNKYWSASFFVLIQFQEMPYGIRFPIMTCKQINIRTPHQNYLHPLLWSPTAIRNLKRQFI